MPVSTAVPPAPSVKLVTVGPTTPPNVTVPVGLTVRPKGPLTVLPNVAVVAVTADVAPSVTAPVRVTVVAEILGPTVVAALVVKAPNTPVAPTVEVNVVVVALTVSCRLFAELSAFNAPVKVTADPVSVGLELRVTALG